MLVFLLDSGFMSSVCTVAALVLNAWTQFTFSAVAFVGFTSDSFPSVDKAKLWRYGSAHDAMWTTAVSGSSLASRVCAKDSSLSVSTGQATLVEDIEQYLDSLLSMPQGGLLCVVACLTSFHLVLAEVLKAGNFWIGTCAMWMGSRRRGAWKRTCIVSVAKTSAPWVRVCVCVIPCRVRVQCFCAGCSGLGVRPRRAMLMCVEIQRTKGVRATGLPCNGDIVTFGGFGTRRFVFICVIVAVRVFMAVSLLYTASCGF